MMAIRTVLGLLVIATVSSGAPQFPKELNFIDAREVTSVSFWLTWAGNLAVAGLNLLAQISDRISPFGV